MILITHAIAGAAAAEIFSSNPIAAFAAAFVSHYILDAIPHWQYRLTSLDTDPNDPHMVSVNSRKRLFRDIAVVFADFLAGIILSVIIFKPTSSYQIFIVIMGAFAGTLPDGLQFAYLVLKFKPLKPLQKVHDFFHSKYKIKKHPFWGALAQAAIIALIVIAFRLF